MWRINVDNELAATRLEKRWARLWEALGAEGDSFPVYYTLIRMPYSTRAYHNLAHIEFCLNEFDKVRDNLKDPLAVEIAIWFHDIVYETQPGSPVEKNEERSGERAYGFLKRLGKSEEFSQRVRGLVMVTKHTGNAADSDARYLADIDTAILGQPQPVFEKYDGEIRDEYSQVPEALYKTERAKILQRFLDRGQVYLTPIFNAMYGAQAKENLDRKIKELRRP